MSVATRQDYGGLPPGGRGSRQSVADEGPLGFESGEDARQDGLLAVVFEVVDGECGDYGVAVCREGGGRIVGEGVGDERGRAETFACEVEHGSGEVDEMKMRLWEGSVKHRGEEAATCTKIDDESRVGRNELKGCGVEGFVAGNELHAVAIIGGGGGVEDVLGVVGSHTLSISNADDQYHCYKENE
jgi:hypothetical protein